MVRALKFKLEGRGSNPPSPFLYLKAILAYLKKPAAQPVRPGRGPSILAWPSPARPDPPGPVETLIPDNPIENEKEKEVKK